MIAEMAEMTNDVYVLTKPQPLTNARLPAILALAFPRTAVPIRADDRIYFFDVTEAASLGVRVYACGHEIPGQALPTQPEWSMKRYGLIYLVRGKGGFESASCPVADVSPGQVMVLFPDEKHRYGALPGGLWEEYWFRIDGSTIRSLHRSGVLDKRNALLTVGLDAEVIGLCESIIQTAGDPTADKRRIPGMVLQLLNDFLVPRRIFSRSETAGKILAVIQEVRRNPTLEWSFVDLARSHGMSYSLLRKQLTAQLGMPPHQFLVRERMRLACQALAQGLSVKQACVSIGMTDQYHFSKLFKKVMGQPPHVYAGSIRRPIPTGTSS
jgi:AraC-like DNA-binding protein